MMNVQIIEVNNAPAFAVIPYEEYETMCRKLTVAESLDSKITFPIEVTEMHAIKGYSLIKAWRLYRGKTQKEMSATLGITQGAFSQIEKSSRNQIETLRKVAAVLNVEIEHLTLD